MADHLNAPAIAGLVREFALPGTVAMKDAINLLHRSRKLCAEKFVRDAANGLVASVAIQVLGTTSPEDDAIVQVANQYRGEIQQTGLLPHFFVGLFTFGDVAQDDGEKLLTGNFGLRDGGLDGELFTSGANTMD